jgi:hypothetical protein
VRDVSSVSRSVPVLSSRRRVPAKCPVAVQCLVWSLDVCAGCLPCVCKFDPLTHEEGNHATHTIIPSSYHHRPSHLVGMSDRERQEGRCLEVGETCSLSTQRAGVTLRARGCLGDIGRKGRMDRARILICLDLN